MSERILSQEERDEIINEAVGRAVEEAMKALPVVVGNLLKEKVAMRKLIDKFYNDHPEYKEHKDLVASIVEQVETENPGAPYSQILEIAAPRIAEGIAKLKGVDTKTAVKPRTNIIEADHGML